MFNMLMKSLLLIILHYPSIVPLNGNQGSYGRLFHSFSFIVYYSKDIWPKVKFYINKPLQKLRAINMFSCFLKLQWKWHIGNKL